MYVKHIRILIIVAALLFLSLSAISAENTVIYYEGDVYIHRGGQELYADFGSRVDAGDVIETDMDSTAIISLGNSSRLKIKENTIIRLDSVTSDTSVTLSSGALFSKINRLAGRSFTVQTPSVVAGVRGTEFFVSFGRTVDAEPDIWLCVNEGSVEVSLPETGDSVTVEEGEGINILGGVKLTDPKFYAWTEDLNWNTDASAGSVKDDTDLDSVYTDLLDQDYF